MYKKEDRVIKVKDVFRKMSNERIEGLNGYHIITYMGVQLFYVSMAEKSMLTLGMLCDTMGISDSRTKKNIKEAVEDLMEWELIKVEAINNKKINTNTTLNVTIPNYGASHYTTVNYLMVKDILMSDYSIQEKGSMLLVYAVLAQYVGGNNYGYPNIDTIAKDAKLSSSTIISALNNLRDVETIIYATATRSYNRLPNNVYVLCDEPNCDEILDNAISNPDELLSWHEVERREDIDAGVYLLHMFDENEDFYKVGTSVDVNRRVEQLEYYYNVEVIDIIHTNLNRAIKLENQLQSENHINKYYPKKHFGGHTECFSELPLSYNTMKERYNE